MDNMKIYNAVRDVPLVAQKTIKGGRLNNFTDINPMWRIHTLTEQFGPCGIGWKYEVVRQWNEPGANNEIASFVEINLYYKHGDAWSEPIPGVGGSMFVAKEKNGLYTSDECYKMALTDALSVACKALGVGADVYWADGTKYSQRAPEKPKCSKCGAEITPYKGTKGEVVSPEKHAAICLKNFGKVLCVDHARDAANGEGAA
ncbi:MAG TPA: hypothetical protein GX701_04480 [Clostridiales bacterium]|nr:hypothetical protein [Clostridiales bacterium]